MKKPVLLAFVALLGTTTLFAQKFEVGINGGTIQNSVPKINGSSPSIIKAKPSPATATESVNVLYNYSEHWQIGLSVNVCHLSYSIYDGIDPLEDGMHFVNVDISNAALPVELSLNRKFKINRVELYGGAFGGYVYVNATPGLKTNKGYNYTVHSSKGSGYTVGAHIGGTYFLTQHWGINGEVAGAYMRLYTNDFHYELYTFPITMGIRYRF